MSKKPDLKPTSGRSRIMSSIRSKETKIEVLLRKTLWQSGIRNYRKYPKLPGKPDLVFPRYKVIIFIDGCFWHGCPEHYKPPQKNKKFWFEKIQENKKRDAEVDTLLRRQGYDVVRIWEHDIMSDVDDVCKQIKARLQNHIM
jgi:DNA mismatch endonuclease (patch repair protein)